MKFKEQHPVVGDYITITLPKVTGKYDGEERNIIAQIIYVKTIRYDEKNNVDLVEIKIMPKSSGMIWWQDSMMCYVSGDDIKASLFYRRVHFKDNSIEAIQRRGIHSMDNLLQTRLIYF